MALTASPAFAAQTHLYTGTSFGPDGTPGTSFEHPSAIAVDQKTHDVYVGDSNASALYKFNENGEAVNFSGSAPYIEGNKINGLSIPSRKGESQIAIDPNNGTIYINNSEHSIRAFQSSGEPADFATLGSSEIGGFTEACGVAIDQNGDFYVGDFYASTVSIFNPNGEPITSFQAERACNLAVDSTGAVYVNDYGVSVGRFIPSFFPVTESTSYTPLGTLDAKEVATVALDPATNDLYATEAGQIVQYDTGNTRLLSFSGFGSPGALVAPEGVAIDGASGRVFASDREGKRQVEIFGPRVLVPSVGTDQASNIASTSGVLNGSVNPEGIDLSSCIFEYGKIDSYGESIPCSESSAEIGTGTEPKAVHADLTGLESGVPYHFRLVATNVNGPSWGGDKIFQTLSLPTVTNEHLRTVTSDEATVEALINTGGAVTTFHVEYGTDLAYSHSTAERNVGSDYTDHPVRVVLNELIPHSAYHWRVVATNSVGTVQGPSRTLGTFGITSFDSNSGCSNHIFRTGPSARLIDCRAYELVSPVAKNNTDIFTPINVQSQLVRLDQAAESGEKLAYTTSAGFGDTAGVPYASQYIASRGTEGWSSHSITPPQGVSPTEGGLRVDLEFRAFTPDLCDAAMRHTTAEPLALGAVEDYFNIYRRHNCGEEGYEAVTTSSPPNEPNTRYAPIIQGLAADGRCTVFRAEDQLTPDANPAVGSADFTNQQLYESCGGQLRLVSMLPNGEANQSDVSAGTANGGTNLREDNDARAVSSNGSRVYWTAVGNRSYGVGDLYLRENALESQSAVSAGGCTEADKACTIAISGGGEGHFWSASPDGSKALYSEGQLIAGADPSLDLYEFDLASKASTLIASQVWGVVGASENTLRVSFVSREVLTSGVNPQGKSPIVDKPNLYFFDSTKTGPDRFQFIGTLSDDDAHALIGGVAGKTYFTPINVRPDLKTSRVSSDGLHIAFMSTASLTGYDNTDADTGEPDAEIFSYSATAGGGEGRLSCVSCNPSGQRPVGRDLELELSAGKPRAAAMLPVPTTELYAPRTISDDGSRVFFDSYDALSPIDANGKADVYEWEAPGAGNCSEVAPSYSALNEGCLSLISSGESTADSEFLDASPDGRDVFFLTGSSLLPQDRGLVDIYDARAGGGYPPSPRQPEACEGEACQGPPAAPNDPTPASSSFEGTGNVKPAAKKKHRKKKTHRKTKKSQPRANDNRRTVR